MARQLTKDELRRCDLVLEAAAAAPSLHEFLPRVLAALHEHLGHTHTEFMLALSEGDLPGYRAYAGANFEVQPHVMEEYFERWANCDALTSDPARRSYFETGRASIADFYDGLTGSYRDYVNEFLRRIGEPEQVSFRLRCGSSDGYVTFASLEDETLVRHLVPALTKLLDARLPRGLDLGLSLRESQVSELVALGFTNREIGAVLHVEEDTVKKHVSRALERIGVTRRTQLAVAWATGVVLTIP